MHGVRYVKVGNHLQTMTTLLTRKALIWAWVRPRDDLGASQRRKLSVPTAD